MVLKSDRSEQRIADYKPFVFVDGEGVRCSLYVSGCPLQCKGCFNQCAQDFSYGTRYTKALQQQILEDLSQSYVQGLTLLGGEPFENTTVCLSLVQAVRQQFGNQKDIWAFSGYTFEQLIKGRKDQQALLQEINVLVDGPFVLAKKSSHLRFKGSSNQRIINVPLSLKKQKAQPYFSEF